MSQAFGLGFQHLPRDHANVNALKTMFDPYIDITILHMNVCVTFLDNSKVNDLNKGDSFTMANSNSFLSP